MVPSLYNLLNIPKSGYIRDIGLAFFNNTEYNISNYTKSFLYYSVYNLELYAPIIIHAELNKSVDENLFKYL